jgi:hypothetical protein
MKKRQMPLFFIDKESNKLNLVKLFALKLSTETSTKIFI